MIKKLNNRKVMAVGVLIVVLALLLAGSIRTHKVYESDTEEFGLLTFHRINEFQMVVDATFHGVAREGDRLYSTYDRSQPRGKSACPT
ncbi:MAG: hypothetical protein PVF66_08845 [Candidatus Aminicenantes bacterium]|jgi:hypothetical protein